ncbi:MAG: hypothetical protein BGO38_04725 [Cellulomonas sp. 73-145]|uniref:alpha/beta fold hydrolase n=1 Tax=Cellulomonas sp. 73-145 TaxID=1895739 RepID=UPI000928021E|nr:alpha/beta hydrolase [Cellulomonas sp. 73-145]OJV57460.1 MAG: hypothetical protein BGO38_04725 [Cellulomonas sp. 73-145]
MVVTVTVAAALVDLTTGTPLPRPAGLTFVEAAGVHTRLVRWGERGTPIVLVHGFAENAQVWAPLATHLSVDHVVYAYDVVGWGYTGQAGGGTKDDEVTQLVGLIAALHLDRPVLVGHSAGAAAVAGAALRAPDEVGGVMFLDGDGLDTGAGAGRRPDLSRAPWSLYSTAALRLALRSDALLKKVYAAQCGPDCAPLDQAGLDVWRRPYRVAGGEAALFKRLSQPVSGFTADQLSRLAQLPLPKAVVFGQADTVFSATAPGETARLIGATPATIVPGGRHLTMVGEPAAVAVAVRELCARAEAA